jgi:hypothetical protein
MASLAEVVATYLTRPDLIDRLPASENTRETFKAFGRILTQIGGALVYVAQLPPSPGYEPWFVGGGGGRLGARGLAALVVHAGKRRANDNMRRPEIVRAIRFLAKPGRRKAAILRKAEILLAGWQETSVFDTIFAESGQNEFEFVRLLESARNGNGIDCNRINEIAVALKPFLVLPRGPKVSAASEAHAFFLSQGARGHGAGGYTWSDLEQDFIDAQTRATRLEFNEPDFDPRPAFHKTRGR